MAAPSPILSTRPEGLYCAAGDFFVDPPRPVHRAVVTHAHSDHARPGHAHYLAADESATVLRERLGEISLQTLAYGERLRCGDASVSLHPAGHVLGSAQVRIEVHGQVWVVSGDYKRAADPTCEAFEPQACHVFITEATFGLPIYRWQPAERTFAEINEWWRDNAALGRASVLFCYAFGKAQRILSSIDPTIGPILTHGAVERLTGAYRRQGIRLPPTRYAADVQDKELLRRALVLAPPSAANTPWVRRFPDYSPAFASGWMQVRGARRQRRVERGFVLSDHVDWPGLIETVRATGAEKVLVTHGIGDPLVRYLNACTIETQALHLDYGEEDATSAYDDVADAPQDPAQS